MRTLSPATRGFMPVYRGQEANRCPGCGRSHWIVGRLLAECAFCATALPIDNGGTTGVGLFRKGRATEDQELAA